MKEIRVIGVCCLTLYVATSQTFEIDLGSVLTTAKTGKSKLLFVKGRCLHLKIIIVLQLSVSYKSYCVLKRSITVEFCERVAASLRLHTHCIQTFKNPQRTQNTLYTVILQILVVEISAS